jgi:hypothetical protein
MPPTPFAADGREKRQRKTTRLPRSFSVPEVRKSPYNDENERSIRGMDDYVHDVIGKGLCSREQEVHPVGKHKHRANATQPIARAHVRRRRIGEWKVEVVENELAMQRAGVDEEPDCERKRCYVPPWSRRRSVAAPRLQYDALVANELRTR